MASTKRADPTWNGSETLCHDRETGRRGGRQEYEPPSGRPVAAYGPGHAGQLCPRRLQPHLKLDETRDAARRTRLANERTYLAWWRTRLTSLGPYIIGLGRIVPRRLGRDELALPGGRRRLRCARGRVHRDRPHARADRRASRRPRTISAQLDQRLSLRCSWPGPSSASPQYCSSCSRAECRSPQVNPCHSRCPATVPGSAGKFRRS